MRLVTLVLILAGSISTVAQNALQPVEAPTSPAAGVLGIQPAAILTPKSADALEFGLFSNIANSAGGFGLPTDFALEFTPYWTKDHSLSLEDYLFPKKISDQIKRNSSFSVATTQNFVLGDSNNTNTNGIGLGYRCSFFFGNGSDKETIQNHRDSLGLYQDAISRIISKSGVILFNDAEMTKELFISEMNSEVELMLANSFPNLDSARINLISNNISTQAEKELPKYNSEDRDNFTNTYYEIVERNLPLRNSFGLFKQYILNRQGFTLDFAYATFLNFPSNNFTQSYVPKQAAWLTPGYRFQGSSWYINLNGIIRYEWYAVEYYKQFFPQSDIYQHNIDYGLAIAARAKRFSLQFELVGRNSSTDMIIGTNAEGMNIYENKSRTDWQYVGTFNFNVNDKILLTYTLGNRFEPMMNPDNTLVSTLGINFAFGAPDASTVQ